MIEQLINDVLSCKELFLEGFYTSKNVHYKGTVDLVTEYDVAIEKKLTEALKVSFPEYTIVGEESTKTIEHPDKAIYIDPIDGTTNFVHGIPFCAISVGIWKNGKPLAGVVYNPILDECFTAVSGKGAFLNGKPIAVSKQTDLQQSLIATGFPYTKVDKGDDYHWVLKTMAALLPNSRDIRRLGAASLDLCYVAQGKFDGFYECNLKPWDMSAGALIVVEAGGMITQGDGNAFDLDSHIIVCSNGAIHEQLLTKLIV